MNYLTFFVCLVNVKRYGTFGVPCYPIQAMISLRSLP